MKKEKSGLRMNQEKNGLNLCEAQADPTVVKLIAGLLMDQKVGMMIES